MEQNFFGRATRFDSDEGVTLKQKWKSITGPTSVSDDDGGCFDCNICLDSAHEPVVTLCGHLFCWPCIYKWLNVRSSSHDVSGQRPNCPVCKANISVDSLVPLYGRGTSQSGSLSKKAQLDLVIPQRPQPSGFNHVIANAPHQNQQLHPNLFTSQSQSFHHQQYFPDSHGGHAAMASSNVGGAMMTSIFNPMIGLFGDLMFARVLGTSATSLYAYPYPHSSTLRGGNIPRMRRQEVQLEKSLNRVTVFLLCCIILCLLLF